MVAASLVHNSRVFHIPVNLTANTGIVLILIRHMHYHKSLVFFNYIVSITKLILINKSNAILNLKHYQTLINLRFNSNKNTFV